MRFFEGDGVQKKSTAARCSNRGQLIRSVTENPAHDADGAELKLLEIHEGSLAVHKVQRTSLLDQYRGNAAAQQISFRPGGDQVSTCAVKGLQLLQYCTPVSPANRTRNSGPGRTILSRTNRYPFSNNAQWDAYNT